MTKLDTVAILAHLVGCPTVSRDPNLPLIEWVRNFLADHGIASQLVPDPTGRKSNLFASIGPSEEGGLVLSGHTDVVPVDGQNWKSDPFTLTERDSKLYGRGSCDMKGFIATALSRMAVWKDSRLRRPVHVMLSYDEEIGCLGAPSMIKAAGEALPKPAAVIVGEPTGMRVASEHKGICTVVTRVRGIEAHSSLTHQGESAVMLAADLIGYLRALSEKIAANPRDGARRFEPPYTTLSVNRISGGTAINILAAACEFGWDIRTVGDDRTDAIIDSLKTFADERLAALAAQGKTCSIETIVHADVPALKADGGAAESLALHALQSSSGTIAVPFGTEAGQFQGAGWSTVVCGPGGIEQAHKPDEFIERSQLIECESFLDRAVARQCR